MHSKFKGQYLNINFKDWKRYTIHDDKHNSEANNGESNTLLVDEAQEDNENDATSARFSVKVVFLVGQTPSNETQQRINAESELNGDLIQESFLDSYNNLTLKTIMMLKWVNGSCCDKGESFQ